MIVFTVVLGTSTIVASFAISLLIPAALGGNKNKNPRCPRALLSASPPAALCDDGTWVLPGVVTTFSHLALRPKQCLMKCVFKATLWCTRSGFSPEEITECVLSF